MKVWIDISNAPHVRFFKDVIKYLEAEGEDVIVTARQFGDIHKLMEMYDIDFISVGKHGVSLYDKLKESTSRVYNLVDVVEGSCRLKQALIRDSRYENLYLLPSAQTKDKSAVSPGQMKKLTAELKEEFDYILLDCPAGIEQGFQNAIAGADRALVVTTPEVSSIRDADRIIGLLEQNQIRTIDLIINRIRMDMVKRGDMMSVDDVTEILAVPLIGILPDDEQVVIGTNQGEPVIGLDSKAGKGYLNICKRITGTEVSFMNLDTGKGVFSRIAHAFRKN